MRAKNLKYLRKKYDEKQTELCKRLHIAQSTFSDFERGKKAIPDDIARSLAHHFRVTLYEFTYFDLSEEDVFFLPKKGFITDKNYLFQILNVWLPIIPPPTSYEDEFFVKGYKQVCSFQRRSQSNQTINRDEILDCLTLFQSSWEYNNQEGALANCIGLILLVCASYCSETNEKERAFIKSIIDGRKLDYLEAQKIVLRDDIDEKKQATRVQARKDFVHDYEGTVMAYIKQLKFSPNVQYRDLADYYLACMYTAGFADNNFDFETNFVIGFNLLSQLYMIDNTYAKQFVSQLMKL